MVAVLLFVILLLTQLLCSESSVMARAHSSANMGAKSVDGRAGGARARVMINVGKRVRAKMQIL